MGKLIKWAGPDYPLMCIFAVFDKDELSISEYSLGIAGCQHSGDHSPVQLQEIPEGVFH